MRTPALFLLAALASPAHAFASARRSVCEPLQRVQSRIDADQKAADLAIQRELARRGLTAVDASPLFQPPFQPDPNLARPSPGETMDLGSRTVLVVGVGPAQPRVVLARDSQGGLFLVEPTADSSRSRPVVICGCGGAAAPSASDQVFTIEIPSELHFAGKLAIDVPRHLALRYADGACTSH